MAGKEINELADKDSKLSKWLFAAGFTIGYGIGFACGITLTYYILR
jgi:hypothetical protein